jgi:hypothetical protein
MGVSCSPGHRFWGLADNVGTGQDSRYALEVGDPAGRAANEAGVGPAAGRRGSDDGSWEWAREGVHAERGAGGCVPGAQRKGLAV